MKYETDFNNSIKIDSLGMAGNASIDIYDRYISIKGRKFNCGIVRILSFISSFLFVTCLAVMFNLSLALSGASCMGVIVIFCFSILKRSTVYYSKSTVNHFKRYRNVILFKATEPGHNLPSVIKFKAKTEKDAIALENAIAC